MKRRKRSDLKIGSLSHPGETRVNNEDNYAIAFYDSPPGVRTPVTLAMVADGIGGHRAGEVASGIAVDIIPSAFDKADTLDYRSLFTHAFADSSEAIAAYTAKHPQSEGLGTTCVAALVFDRSLYTASIGDSRIYLLREGNLQQISIDHSWVQEARDKGILSTEEARNHPRRNVLRRYLGAAADPTPDFRLRLSPKETDEQSLTNQGYPLQKGDRVFLCSDGLNDMIDDAEITAALREHADPQAAIDELVRRALTAGGTDNVTAVVLEVGAAQRSILRLLFWAAGVFIVLGGLGLLGVFVWAIMTLPGT